MDDAQQEATHEPKPDYVELAADIVSAYVSNNPVPAAELPGLLGQVHGALTGLVRAQAANGSGVERPTPAQVKKSISHDALVSFEDGKPYKTLRRHLTIRGLTPEAYRAKWGLPADYPMTAASYSEQRSSLARSLGLGLQRRKPATKAAAPAETVAEAPAEAPKARTRRKAAEPGAEKAPAEAKKAPKRARGKVSEPA
ncbi:MucR family transcriptional regulator [Methylobacterium sp. A54F]